MKNEDNTVNTFVQILEEFTRPGDSSKRFEDPQKGTTKNCPHCKKPMKYDSHAMRFTCPLCHSVDGDHKINP